MCCQELLEFWLRIQRGMEPDTLHFHESVRKVAALTHDLKHISVLLDVLTSEVTDTVSVISVIRQLGQLSLSSLQASSTVS